MVTKTFSSCGESTNTNKPSIIKADDNIKIKNGKFGVYIEYRNPKGKKDSKPINVKIYGKKPKI